MLAQTGDLRALAVIAGEDPATLYVGTALDGVDISGQDLRGMHLPNLDLEKVIWDERTKLDPPYSNGLDIDPGPPGDPRAIVFCPNTYKQLEVERITRGMRVRLYPRLSFGDFFAEPETPDVPKFVIGGGYDSDSAKGAILVVPLSPGRPLNDRIGHYSANTGPIVFVPLPRRPTTDDVLHGAVGDFVALAAHNPGLIREIVKEHPVFAFCSARGAGHFPRLDAILRIFANLETFEANVVEDLTSLFQFAELSSTEATAAGHLFPTHRTFYGRRPMGWNEFSRASVLVALTNRDGPPRGGFFDAATQLFLDNGWSLSGPAKARSFQINGDEHSYEVILRRPKFTIRRRGQPIPTISNKRIHVVATVSEEDCYLSLMRGQILVGLSDCANFQRDDGSIWNLIGSQAVRVAATRQNRIRWRYFGHLVKLAIERSSEPLPAWAVDFMAHSPAFPITVSHIGSAPNGPEFLVSPSVGRAADIGIPIILRIGADGPRLEEIRRIPSNERNPSQLMLTGIG